MRGLMQVESLMNARIHQTVRVAGLESQRFGVSDVVGNGDLVGRLIVLNGPAGCGKSTLAQRFADDHPLVLNLDIDRLRGMLGCWRDELALAGPIARTMALAVARVHLDSGRDVIVPQFLGRPEFLGQLEQLAREAGAG
jgi:predicted kinase